MKQFFSILSIMFLLSCGHETQELNKAAVTEEIKLMLENYHNDIKSHGLTAEFKYLDHSNDFFWVPPGYNTPLSYDSVKTILTKSAPGFSKIEFQWKNLLVFPLTDKLASYTGIVEGTMTDTTGTAMPVSIIESGTVIKRKDGWKLLCGQSAVVTKNP